MKYAIPIITFILGTSVGYYVSHISDISDYETPILAMHSVLLQHIDNCLDKQDIECTKKVLTMYSTTEAQRANALIEKGLPSDSENEVKDALLFFTEFTEKHK